MGGDRRRYTNPLKYAFVTTTVHALLFTFVQLDVLGGEYSLWRSPEAIEGFALAHGLLGYLIFPMTLVLAALQRVLFRARTANVAECFVCLLFVSGHLMWLTSAAALLGMLETTWGTLVMEAVGMAYFVWAVAGFYQDYRAATLLKAILVRVVGALLFVAITLGAGLMHVASM